MSASLRERVCAANVALFERRLARFSFGNASAIDRATGLVYIKPSGVSYDAMSPADVVVVRLDGNVQEGTLRPSSDTPTHLALYRAFPGIGGVAHTHSRYATAFAQAQREIHCLGTTHADFCDGAVPLTADLSAEEIAGDYEANTGAAIVRRLAALDPLRVPAALVARHAPFCWGATVGEAVEAASMLEEVAHLAWLTLALDPAVIPVSGTLRRKHFDRKHGPAAYYGQEGDRRE